MRAHDLPKSFCSSQHFNINHSLRPVETYFHNKTIRAHGPVDEIYFLLFSVDVFLYN